MKIKILYLLSNFRAGGAERQLFNLIHGIDKQFFEVHIGLIQYRDNRPSSEFLEALADVHVCLFERKHSLDVSVIIDVARYARNHSIDLIQSLLFMDNQIARLAGLLSKRTVITSIRGEILPLLGKKKTWFEYRMQRLSSKIIVNSSWLKEYLVDHGSRSDKVVVIYNGTESSCFKSDADALDIRKKYSVPEDALLMGVVARLHPMKNHIAFFDTVSIVRRSLPNVHAVVVGNGELMDDLQAYVKAIGLQENVTFLGTVTKELPDIYRMMDVYLLSSRWGESFPNVILEAMSAGVPVVATNISAVPEIITDGEDGFLVEKNNPEMMADRVLKIVSDEKLRKRFIQHGIVRAEKFGVESMVDRYMLLYNDICNNSL